MADSLHKRSSSSGSENDSEMEIVALIFPKVTSSHVKAPLVKEMKSVSSSFFGDFASVSRQETSSLVKSTQTMTSFTFCNKDFEGTPEGKNTMDCLIHDIGTSAVSMASKANPKLATKKELKEPWDYIERVPLCIDHCCWSL